VRIGQNLSSTSKFYETFTQNITNHFSKSPLENPEGRAVGKIRYNYSI